MLNSIPHLTKKRQDDTLKKIQDGSSNPEIASLRSQRRGWGLNSSFSRHSDIVTTFLLRDPLPFTVARDLPPPHSRGLSPSVLARHFPLAIAGYSPSRHHEAVSLWPLRGSFLLRHREAFPLSSSQGTFPLAIAGYSPPREATSSASFRGLFSLVIARHLFPRHYKQLSLLSSRGSFPLVIATSPSPLQLPPSRGSVIARPSPFRHCEARSAEAISGFAEAISGLDREWDRYLEPYHRFSRGEK
jgi:hypothetical protein